MLSLYRVHLSVGMIKTFSKKEIIANVESQIKEGVKPHYKLARCGKVDGRDESVGWLVWSSMEDGCGVVCKMTDGRYVMLVGNQGDFVYV